MAQCDVQIQLLSLVQQARKFSQERNGFFAVSTKHLLLLKSNSRCLSHNRSVFPINIYMILWVRNKVLKGSVLFCHCNVETNCIQTAHNRQQVQAGELMRQKVLTLLEMWVAQQFTQENLVGDFFSYPYRQSTVKSHLAIISMVLYPSVSQLSLLNQLCSLS